MRLARWLTAHSQIGEGFVIDDSVVPFPSGVSMKDVLDSGLIAARSLFNTVSSETGTPLAEVSLQAPLQPASIRDFVAFEEHVEGISGSVDGKNEVVDQWFDAPTFYFTNPHTVRATGETVPIPDTAAMDMEAELAVVVGGVEGSDGENLSPEEAREHIFGFTVLNDWSARDLQSREMKVRLGPCKGKDFGLTLGPWIVTADELEGFVDDEGFHALRGEVLINGALVGEDLVSNMGWPFAELVSYAARNSRVVPGDVLGSGTFGNGGCLGELWGHGSDRPPLQPGDEVRIRFEGVGEIVNVVGDRVPLPPVRPARKRTRSRVRTVPLASDAQT